MDARQILRILCLASFVMTAAVNAGAKNLAKMVASLLDVVTGYSPARADDGKYHVIVLYNSALLSDSQLHDGQVYAQRKQINNRDVYAQLVGIDAAERIQCVILVDLAPQQVIAAEQFARDKKVVIASVLPSSTNIDRGSVPFIFDVQQQVVMVRSASISSYGLNWTSSRPKGVPELAGESRFRNVDSCPPLLPDDRDAYPYVACHDNAFARMNDKSAWHEGVRDLDTAILINFEEKFDARVYPRGWGLKGYHPHIGLADYLSRYGNCEGAQRELKIALLPKDAKTRAALEQRIKAQCAAHSVAEQRLRWSILARDNAGAGESELLPPFRPTFLWTEITTLR
ncbi:MAG TPA: hypothetical protein VNN25_15745 [Thermoanaerobaculia bacterium]|nr:hypothetical protein [Thermoanaerobaculia bacterium]